MSGKGKKGSSWLSNQGLSWAFCIRLKGAGPTIQRAVWPAGLDLMGAGSSAFPGKSSLSLPSFSCVGDQARERRNTNQGQTIPLRGFRVCELGEGIRTFLVGRKSKLMARMGEKYQGIRHHLFGLFPNHHAQLVINIGA